MIVCGRSCTGVFVLCGLLQQKCRRFIESLGLRAPLAVQTAAVRALLALLTVTDQIKLQSPGPLGSNCTPGTQKFTAMCCVTSDFEALSGHFPGIGIDDRQVLHSTTKRSLQPPKAKPLPGTMEVNNNRTRLCIAPGNCTNRVTSDVLVAWLIRPFEIVVA